MFNKKTQRIILIIIAIILVITMIGGLFVAAFADEASSPLDQARIVFNSNDKEDGRIIEGIKVGPVDVSGLTLEEARTKAYQYVDELRAQTITISANNQTNSIAAGDLGFHWTNPDSIEGAPSIGKSGNLIERYKVYKDCLHEGHVYPMQFDVDEDAVRSFVAQTAVIVDVPVKEPGIVMLEDRSLNVTEGQNGLALDQEACVQALLNTLRNEWEKGSATLNFDMVVTEPIVSNDEMYSVNAVLGSGETSYKGSKDTRIQNLKNAVGKINGTVLLPGQQISVTSLLVPFEEWNGYALAHSFSEGSLVDTYGGGVCQVSTTLYLAVLMGELQVDERHPHSMLVEYANPSMDAAIAEGIKDFKFTNNTDAPVFISGSIDEVNQTIHFDIYGHETRDPNRIVGYSSETDDLTAATVEISTDSSVAFGLILQTNGGHTGAKSHMNKLVSINGEITEELVNEDEYQMQPIVYVIGTKGASASARADINAAIGDDIESVHDVIAAIGANGGNAQLVQVYDGEEVPQ
ncbi:MAG: VanW family protein [Lachnospiraceae bacterium]|nr:VanW family protein [Candidatus Equihabitans merdae]